MEEEFNKKRDSSQILNASRISSNVPEMPYQRTMTPQTQNPAVSQNNQGRFQRSKTPPI